MASTINASNSGFGGIVSTGDSSGQLQLQTANTTAVTIDTSQNVGIGTATPSSYGPFVVSKSNSNLITAVGNSSANTAQEITLQRSSSATTIQNAPNITFADGTANNTWTMQAGSGNMQFWNYNSGWAERMRIDSSGNVLVGTTSASTAPATGFTFNPQTAGAYAAIGHTTSAGSGAYYISFGYNGGVIGTITQNGTTAVAYNTSSDYRLKDNIVPMTGALNTVSQLKPVTYTWKSDNSAGQGFIAHELQAVVPDCVTGEKDAVDAEGKPVYQGVDTSFLVATLTAAIQEQQEIINDLKARIETLESK